MRISTLGGWILIGLYTAVFGYAGEVLDVPVSVPPGEYASDVTLQVMYPSPAYQVLYRFTDSLDPAYVPYRVPVVLTALEGEDRRYEIEYQLYEGKSLLKTGRVFYRIDKRPPLVPIPSQESGEYLGKVSVSFQKEPDSDVYVAVYRGEKPAFTRWNGEPVQLQSGPTSTQITLLYYAQDKVGNTSPVEARTFTLYPASPAPDAFLKVLSPTEGSFLNPQVLWIEHRGYEWIRYRINDAPTYQTYQQPILLETAGLVKVEVSAKRLFSPTIETKSITFRQENRAQDLPPSRVYSLEEEVTIPLGKGKYRYNLEDRAVEPYDPESPDRLSLYPLSGHNRVVAVRLKPTTGTAEGEYRYLVELKGEVPGDVAILFDETRVHRETALVTLKGRSGSQLYYTLDGSLPTTNSFLYEGPFQVPLPPNSEGFLTIRARARMGQRWGPVTEKFLEYDTAPPPQPVPQYKLEKPSGYAILEIPSQPGVEGIYEISWGEKVEPAPLSLASPRVRSKQWIRIPYGYHGVGKLRIGYRDRAGNITEAPRLITLAFDRIPPATPQVSVQDRMLTLGGEGSLFYQIDETTGTLEVKNQTGSFLPYTGPIELPAPEGQRVTYRILAYAEDQAGNRSEMSSPYIVSFDRRVPTSLLPSPPPNVPLPITNKEFVLSFPDPRGDLDLFYTFTEDGSEPPDPTTSSLKGASILRFYGQEGKRIPYTVKVWARYRGSTEKGQVQKFQFVIDREPPRLPKVEGITPSVRNRGALIRFQGDEPTDKVFFRISEVNDAKDSTWIPYTEPILLDVEEGKEATFTVFYRVVDDAGNSVESPQPIKLVIDKKPPFPPVVEVQKGIFLKATEGQIHYELSTDGSIPRIPTENSPQSLKELPRTFQEGSYISLAARTRDEAGNWSDVIYLTDIPSLPLLPHQNPVVHTLSLGNHTLLTWEERAEVSMEGLDPQEGFTLRRVKNPWILESTKEREVLIQVKDSNEKNPIKVKLVAPPSAVPVRIAGGEKGEYPRGIQLQNQENSVILRYEISTGNLPPRKVDHLSPRLERPLTLDALPEETVYYRIQVQNYSKNNIPVSPAQEFTVKIDRTPPPPPELVGVEAGSSYGQDVTLSIQAKEGNPFYAVDSVEEGKPAPGLPKENQFKPFEKPLPISVPEGTSRIFWVSAFTRDSVGNISRQIPRWNFMVDKQYLYVIEGKTTQGNGTRLSPYTNLETALEAASKGSRTRIRIAAGTYRITKPIPVKRDLYLFGGFDRNGWTSEGGISKFVLDSSGFKGTSSNAYFAVEGATFKLDRCQIEGGDGKGRAVFWVRNGTLELSFGSVTVLGKDRVLDQGNGTVILDRSEFRSSRMDADALVTVSGGTFRSKESRFSFQRSEQGGPLLRFRKASVLLESATLSPGEGEISLGIEAEDSQLRILFSTIQTGAGTLAAYGLRIKGGSLQMERSEIQHTPAAYISIGIGLLESKGEITASALRIGGRYGAQAFHVRTSELILRENLLEGDSTEDYLYYGTFEDSSVRFVGNVFRKGLSAEITAFQLLNSRMEGEKNTFEFGTSKRGFSGFVLKGKSDLVLKGSTILAPDPKGILFVLPRDEIKVLVAENTFNVQGAYRELQQGGRRILIRTLKDLEASSTDEVRFEKNRN